MELTTAILTTKPLHSIYHQKKYNSILSGASFVARAFTPLYSLHTLRYSVPAGTLAETPTETKGVIVIDKPDIKILNKV